MSGKSTGGGKPGELRHNYSGPKASSIFGAQTNFARDMGDSVEVREW